MNDKIYQLNLTAMSIVLNGDDPDNDIEQMYIPKEFTKKFAELIVRECAHLVGGYTKENEFGTDVKEAYEEITKHFGVEE